MPALWCYSNMTGLFTVICKYCHFLGIATDDAFKKNWYCRHLYKESAGVDCSGRVDHVDWKLFKERHNKKELKFKS